MQMVEFGEEVSSHELQVNSQEIGGKYDMIIRSDIMTEMGVDLLYSDHYIKRDGVYILLKLQGELSDRKYCKHCTICIPIPPFF